MYVHLMYYLDLFSFQGVPEFENIENVVTTLTSFIFICSVEHSAANFPQFDHYGYPPNHPAILDMAEHKDVKSAILNSEYAYIYRRNSGP